MDCPNAVIGKNVGTWEGKQFSFSPDGKILFSSLTKLEIGIKGRKYLQRNTYSMENGKEYPKEYVDKTSPSFHSFDEEKGILVKIFDGEFDDKWTLHLNSNGFKGKNTTVSDLVNVYVTSDPVTDKMRSLDVITSSEDNMSRSRTWQVFDKDGKLVEFCNIVEQRASDQNPYEELKNLFKNVA